jgi:RimJ/RimL family protein N-acetyltransferase
MNTVSLPRLLALSLLRRIRGVIRVKRFEVWHRELDGPVPQVEAGVDVHFRLAGREDLPLFKGVVPDTKIAEFEHRLSEGHKCILGLSDGRIVFHIWFAIGTQYPADLNRALDPGSGYAYMYDMMTVSEHRGKRIASAGKAYVCAQARDAGCSRAICWIDVKNEPSRRTVKSLGFIPRWRAVRVTLFGRNRFRCRPVATGS